MMKLFPNGAASSLVLVVLFLLLTIGGSLRLSPHHYTTATSHEMAAASTYEDHQAHINHQALQLIVISSYFGFKERATEGIGMEVHPTGSSLPDCSHACGPCFPCKRVMVSFKCSVAESCPIVYRCMCKGKYYHVPSN
ncbi:hypothetical protein Pint_07786 [Pistacia integerrima]|uniref:Uncharacterized protein n=1 Tax=Pistacia integerrima TaxID=434235 RepID=A0ACC0Y014_9ROSI|nr:hypothetical protein Pint_07786 [Pistacia integerrima]